jgi:hypothetical protein
MPNVPIEGPKLAVEIAKQLITISLALLAFTVAFANAFKDKDAAHMPIPANLSYAWALYLLTIFFALWTMMAATGTALEADKGSLTNPKHNNIQFPTACSIVCFFSAIVLTAMVGWAILHS